MVSCQLINVCLDGWNWGLLHLCQGLHWNSRKLWWASNIHSIFMHPWWSNIRALDYDHHDYHHWHLKQFQHWISRAYCFLVCYNFLTAKATYAAIAETYSYLTPDLWKETVFTKSPYQVKRPFLLNSYVKGVGLKHKIFRSSQTSWRRTTALLVFRSRRLGPTNQLNIEADGKETMEISYFQLLVYGPGF